MTTAAWLSSCSLTTASPSVTRTDKPKRPTRNGKGLEDIDKLATAEGDMVSVVLNPAALVLVLALAEEELVEVEV